MSCTCFGFFLFSMKNPAKYEFKFRQYAKANGKKLSKKLQYKRIKIRQEMFHQAIYSRLLIKFR